jgi:hypothetical protein
LIQGCIILRGSRIGGPNIPRRKAAKEKRKSLFRVWGLTPSYERSHHGYMMNVISCCWNTMAVAILDFSQKNSK